MFKLDTTKYQSRNFNLNKLILKLNKTMLTDTTISPKALNLKKQDMLPVVEQSEEPMFEIY